MSNELTVGIIGIYTAVYVIVFFIQKSQIDNQREIIVSMKSFNDIFDVKKVKEYAEIIDETNLMKLDKLISDDKTVNEVMRKIVGEKVNEIQKIYTKEKGKQHIEMTYVIIELLKNIEKKDRELFITENLHNCKHIFIPMLDDIETNEF